MHDRNSIPSMLGYPRPPGSSGIKPVLTPEGYALTKDVCLCRLGLTPEKISQKIGMRTTYGETEGGHQTKIRFLKHSTRPGG